MDPVEKKVSEFYKERRQEDEKSMPGFKDFWDKLEPTKIKKRSYLLFKVAASVTIFVAGVLYYFYSSNQPAKETGEIYQVNINQPLPSQSLLDQSLGTEYIWDWKPPTDQLLEDARKSIKTGLYKKI